MGQDTVVNLATQAMTLAMEVENRFRVRLDELDEGSIETVGDLVAVVRRKLGD